MPLPDNVRIEMFERIFEALPSAVAVYDKTGTMVYANSAAAQLGGLESSEELLALPREGVAARNRVTDAQGAPIPPDLFASRLAARGVPTTERLVQQTNPDGMRRWLSVSSAPLYDSAGALCYVVTFALDVTVQKGREEKIRFLMESEKILSLKAEFTERICEKAKLMVPALADWCIIDLVDEDKALTRAVIVHEDPEKEKMLRTWSERLKGEPRAPSVVTRALLSGKPEFYPAITPELLRERTQGDEHFALLRKMGVCSGMIIPITSQGEVLGVMSLAYAQSGRRYSTEDFEFMQEFGHHLGILFDNARLYSEIQERDKAKDAFLAALSHELRNPLAPIRSSLEYLGTIKLEGGVSEQLAIMEQQFEHLNKLLNDLLNVTRLTQGRITIRKEPVDLRALLERTVRTNRAFIRNKGIALTMDLPEEPVVMQGDPVRLEQAFTNVLRNAEKFTPPGGEIAVSLSTAGDVARIVVRDSGIGIKRSDLHKIFELHYQGEHRIDHPNSGLGIGLVLVREILRLHGGSVEAVSAGLGKGSTFTLTLPYTPGLEPPAPRQEHPLSSPVAAGQRVLVVDDNGAAARGLGALLEHSGYETRLAYDGTSALKLVREFNPSVILLDIGLPDLSGYEVARRLRELAAGHPLLIALTGYGQEEDKRNAAQAGFDYHLTKPVGIAEVEQILRNQHA